MSILRISCLIMTINVMNVDSISIPTTNSIRFGPAGFMGTVALFKVVKAGVFSCSFAFMASSWVHMAV